ncbi:MAG: hypothetical protein WC854_11855 [Bacteroidales bacterium]
MKFTALKLPPNCLEYLEKIDSLQEVYDSIKFETVFEPIQIRHIENGKMNVQVTSYLDLKAWQKEIAYSSIVKMRTTENSIYSSLSNDDFYTFAILLRHHMENAGLLALLVDTLMESFQKKDFNILNKFISKTWFGNSFYNKPMFRDSDEAFGTIETVSISAMINALDNFLESLNIGGKKPKDKSFANNYTWLCQFAHPNATSSSFFTETNKTKTGTYINFKWNGNFIAEEGYFRLLSMLVSNMIVGYANFFIFLSFEFSEGMTITQNQKLAIYAYDNILTRFKQ